MQFKLSEKEEQNFIAFTEKMEEKYTEEEMYCGAAGGFFSIEFIMTGLGNIVYAKTKNDDKEDITDWDNFG